MVILKPVPHKKDFKMWDAPKKKKKKKEKKANKKEIAFHLRLAISLIHPKGYNWFVYGVFG